MKFLCIVGKAYMKIYGESYEDAESRLKGAFGAVAPHDTVDQNGDDPELPFICGVIDD